MSHPWEPWAIWRCLWPWRWFGPDDSLADLVYWAWRRDWVYVRARYFTSWSRQSCGPECQRCHWNP
jgi:hypothetical protein